MTTDIVHSHEEDGIKVEEVDGEVWGRTDGPCGFDVDGNVFWGAGYFACYGYTKITRSDASEFVNIGLLAGVPECPADIFNYVLREHGSIVATGTISRQSGTTYIGFYGGGFDEVLLRGDFSSVGAGFFSGERHRLTLDAVELSDVLGPPPTSYVVNITASAYGGGANPKLPVLLPSGDWAITRVSPATDPEADFYAWTANNVSIAWRTEFGFELENGEAGGGGFCCAETPEAAFAATPLAANSFFVQCAAPTICRFWIQDGILWDNLGGVSLRIVPAGPTMTKDLTWGRLKGLYHR